jgi:lactoylglutathione lyase
VTVANGTGPLGLHIARIGNGVTDLTIAAAFYEALGFALSSPFDLGTSIAAQSEVPGSPLVIQMARRDGIAIELVQHGGARPPGRPPARRPMNQLGFSHLALATDDIDRVGETITSAGGFVYGFTRTDATGGPSVFAADSCGLRILLLGQGSCLRSATPGSDGVAVDHFGICVADLRESAAFYEAVGFGLGSPADLSLEFSGACELDDVPMLVQRARLGDYPVLLTQWGDARPAGTPVRLPLNRVGELIHFGTHGDDFDGLLDVIVRAGGTVVERTRSTFPPAGLAVPSMHEPHGWVFVLDPNGVQIEIVGPRSKREPTTG